MVEQLQSCCPPRRQIVIDIEVYAKLPSLKFTRRPTWVEGDLLHAVRVITRRGCDCCYTYDSRTSPGYPNIDLVTCFNFIFVLTHTPVWPFKLAHPCDNVPDFRTSLENPRVSHSKFPFDSVIWLISPRPCVYVLWPSNRQP